MPGGAQAVYGIHGEPGAGGRGKERVQEERAQHQAGGRVEIASHAGGQGWGWEERVAQGGNGPGDSQQHHGEQADGGQPGGFAAPADQRLAGRPPGCEGEAGEQREGVDQMRGERVNIGVVGHVLAFDEKGADESFGNQESAREHSSMEGRELVASSSRRMAISAVRSRAWVQRSTAVLIPLKLKSSGLPFILESVSLTTGLPNGARLSIP